MNPESTTLLRTLLRERRVGALGTLRDGAPAVSMVPFVATPDGQRLFIHVSGLAAHTANMLADARVNLLVMDLDRPENSALSLGRVSLGGRATLLEAGAPGFEAARAAYIARFPDSVELFDFADFRLFAIDVDEARLVAGFARAHSLSADDLARFLK